jgi:type II secretory pathway pseudopilin PulG
MFTPIPQSPVKSTPVRFKKNGLTLLELTVVILVLLALISVLFIGARAWKKGSDRAGCIVLIRNVQQGVRSYCNLYGFNPGTTVTGFQNQIIGVGRFVEKTPACPSTGTYTYLGDTVPTVGTLYMTCSLATSETHQPTAYTDW